MAELEVVRQKTPPVNDTAISILFCGALLIGVPVVILVARDRINDAIWRWRNPPEKLEAERREYEQRILNPDWDFYEAHLQRPVPKALRDLYDNHSLIVSDGLDYNDEDIITSFGAIDQEGLDEARPWLGFDAVAFASNIFGDPIYLRPGPNEANIVYVTYHDGGDTEELAPDVETFVRNLRR